MITQTTVQNFKCIRNLTVNLDPFTVLVGANGSGKTALLQSIARMHGGVYIQCGDERRSLAVREDYLGSIRTYSMSIFPHIKDMRLNNYGTLEFDMAKLKNLQAWQMGSGFDSAVRTLMPFHEIPFFNLVLLDDLGANLHPTSQQKLVEILRSFQKERPKLQIIASTNSPYLLGSIGHAEVRMLALGENGLTRCAALTQHPKFQTWKDEFNAGEMWSLFGEQWATELPSP